EGLAMGPFSIAWEPHTALYGMYTPEQPRNSSHVADARIVSMLKEDADEGSRSAPEDHLRHPAVRCRPAVLRLPLLRRSDRLVAAVREELLAELQLRLREPVGGALARSVGRPCASTF